MTSEGKCLLWGTPATILADDYGRNRHVDSPRAGGRYTIFGETGLEPAEKARLTTWIIDQHTAGIEDPNIDSSVIAAIRKRRSLSVTERGERLLEHIQTLVPSIGDTVKVRAGGTDSVMHAMLAWSESCKMSEVTYLLDYLVKSGFLETSPLSTLDYKEYAISPAGYAHLTTRAADATRAFVAMWFDDSMNETYDKGFQPAIEDTGYRAVRIDREDYNDKIYRSNSAFPILGRRLHAGRVRGAWWRVLRSRICSRVAMASDQEKENLIGLCPESWLSHGKLLISPCAISRLKKFVDQFLPRSLLHFLPATLTFDEQPQPLQSIF